MLKSELVTHLVADNPHSEKLQPFKNELVAILEQVKVGLQSSDNVFGACPISITPWQLSNHQFSLALDTARALSQLFRVVSCHSDFLINSLSDFSDSSSLIFHLKQNLIKRIKPLATGLNLSRQDLLLDKKGLWRLVESNSIAAGMGPFCEALREIQATYFELPAGCLPENPATLEIARHLYQAAKGLNNNQTPLVVFVVVENEDNIHDQNKISSALIKFGARVLRKTFKQLLKELKTSELNGLIIEQKAVDCFYFRTGYNLNDYIDSKGEFTDFLNLRFWIEQHRVVVAPLNNLQLATSKWVQMKLSNLSAAQLVELFAIDTIQAQLCVQSLALKYVVPQTVQEIDDYLESGLWILKTQNEGGGNVADKNSLNLTTQQAGAQFILMQKIDTVVREGGLTAFAHKQFKVIPKAISEFGVLTLGEQDCYGGYLLRSKPADQLETGVHQAGGVLDTIAITIN